MRNQRWHDTAAAVSDRALSVDLELGLMSSEEDHASNELTNEHALDEERVDRLQHRCFSWGCRRLGRDEQASMLAVHVNRQFARHLKRLTKANAACPIVAVLESGRHKSMKNC